jgi:hypothetical protein
MSTVLIIGASRGIATYHGALPPRRSSPITKIVLLSLRVGTHIPRRHQPSIVTKCPKFPAEMVGTNTSLHTDQARRHIRQPCFDLATRPLLPQHYRAALIETHDVKMNSCRCRCRSRQSQSVLSLAWRAPCLGAPGQLIAGGAGARPDHPISDIAAFMDTLCSRHYYSRQRL